jgi:hypothetical protein
MTNDARSLTTEPRSYEDEIRDSLRETRATIEELNRLTLALETRARTYELYLELREKNLL